MSPVLLVILFVVSAVLGYIIIRNVPALLHTPLMSGMNALSGVTVLGAIIAAFAAKGWLALVLALGYGRGAQQWNTFRRFVALGFAGDIPHKG